MAWRLIVQPNGLLARFSTVVDNFTDYDMTEAEVMVEGFEEWDCGRATLAEKMDRAWRETDPYEVGAKTSRPPLTRYREALAIIGIAHGAKARAEAEALMGKAPPGP